MSSIHDRLFRTVFVNPANAVAVIRAVLPKTLLDQIDLDTLEADPTNFVGTKLQENRSELVFRATLRAGGMIYFFVLFEHKSYQDEMASVQVMVNMGQLWQRHHRDHPGTAPPPIVPILVYHGDEPWKCALGPQQMISLAGLDAEGSEAVLAGTPTFVMNLENLPALQIEAILRRAMPPVARAVLFCLEWFSSPSDSEEAKRLSIEAFVAIRLVPAGEKELDAICEYLLEIRATKPELVEKFIHEYIDEETMKTFVSIADQLRAEGKAEGKAEGEATGKAKGKAELLLSQLTERFGDIPASVQERVHAASEAKLNAWAIRVLKAKQLEQVFR